MKKPLLLTAFLFCCFTMVFAQQRYADIKVKLLTPSNGDTLSVNNDFDIDAQFTNLGPDTFRITDTAQYILEFDGSPILFVIDTSKPPTPYLPLTELEILPGDSTVFSFSFTVFSGWPPGATDICVELIPFNAADSITDSVLTNNRSCATVYVKDPASVSRLTKYNSKDIGISPNPAFNEADVRFSLSCQTDVSIQVLDMTGRVILQHVQMNMPAGTQLVKLDTSGLPEGVFICSIKLGEEHYTQKLMVSGH